MDFLEMQSKFTKLNLDTRPLWGNGGESNKEAINEGYKTVHRKVIQDRSIQEVMKTEKILISISGKEGVLPDNFFQPVSLYFKVGSDFSIVDKEEFPYRYIRTAIGYSVIFEIIPGNSVYIEYIPKITLLNSDTDIITLPFEFESDILNYALVEYFREQRDWMNVTNSLQYAEGKMIETIDQFWLE